MELRQLAVTCEWLKFMASEIWEMFRINLMSLARVTFLNTAIRQGNLMLAVRLFKLMWYLLSLGLNQLTVTSLRFPCLCLITIVDYFLTFIWKWSIIEHFNCFTGHYILPANFLLINVHLVHVFFFFYSFLTDNRSEN